MSDDFTLTFHEVMYHSILVFNQHGYYNNTRALIHDTQPTSKRVIESLKTQSIDFDSEEYKTIDYIIQWLTDNQKSGLSSYMKNARNAVNHGIQSMSEIGLIASLIVPYNKYCKDNK